MLSYEQLDAIADANNPLLGVVCLCRLLWLLWQRRWNCAARMTGLFVCVIFIAKAMEKIDIAFSIWPSAGLDYSTHTAVAVAASSVLLCFWTRWWMVWALWLGAYFALMRWQDYHTWGDMLSTLLVVSVCILPLAWWLRERPPSVARDPV